MGNRICFWVLFFCDWKVIRKRSKFVWSVGMTLRTCCQEFRLPSTKRQSLAVLLLLLLRSLLIWLHMVNFLFLLLLPSAALANVFNCFYLQFSSRRWKCTCVSFLCQCWHPFSIKGCGGASSHLGFQSRFRKSIGRSSKTGLSSGPLLPQPLGEKFKSELNVSFNCAPFRPELDRRLLLFCFVWLVAVGQQVNFTYLPADRAETADSGYRFGCATNGAGGRGVVTCVCTHKNADSELFNWKTSDEELKIHRWHPGMEN